MTLEDILQSIRNWNAERQISTDTTLLGLFNKGTGFEFNVPYLELKKQNYDSSVPLTYHAYLGLYNGDLLYFLIESARDNEAQFKDGILEYIIVCPLCDIPFPVSFANDQITQKQAATLVNNWNNFGKLWMEEQKASPCGIYQAFVIPFEDIEPGEKYTAYFALSNANELMFDSDLVLCSNQNPQQILSNYFDLVRPIPPFKASEFSKEQFFLLDLALD